MYVLVTGASRGLGLALAKVYAKGGHTVFATARAPEASKGLMALAGQYPGIVPLTMDVTDWASVEACARAVAGHTDVVDLVINSAGVLPQSDVAGPIHETDPDVLREIMAVNVEGPILVLKAFYLLLVGSAGRKFYVITSESTIGHSWHGMPVYSLSKVAANKATGIIRATLGEGFEVLAIHPGRMRTDMNKTSAEIEAMEAAEGIYGPVE